MADAKQIEDKSKTAAEPEDELAGSEAPLMDHLIELRKRLIHSVIAIVLLTLVIRAMGGFASKKKALAEAVTEENAAVETA